MQTKNLAMQPKFSEFLDLVRWLAALLVVLHHGRHLWFVDLADVPNKTLLIKVFYFLTGFGSEAVMVFFLLSGYLVGGGALRKWRSDSYSSVDYMISRFSRIYTLLVPVLIFGALIDWIGLHYLNGTEIYTNSPRYHTKSLGFVISDNLNIPTFFSNLFNFQDIFSSHFGSNSPLWSLSYEWWYYCLFALILEVMSRKTTDVLYWVSGG
jgi:peptidoglycan/LPS O-acetylase OafA/YrhL